MQKGLLMAAVALGGLVTYGDTRPTWDDTGVTAAVFLTCSSAVLRMRLQRSKPHV